MQRSLAVVALVVLVTGLGTIGYLQVAGEAGEPPPAPASASSPTPTPSAKPEPIVAPTRAPRPEPSPSPTAEPTPTPNAAESRPPSSEPVPVEPPAGDAYTEDEYRAIYEDLNLGIGWITTRPGFDPEELRLYVSEDCPCLQPLLDQFEGRRAAGEVVDGVPIELLSFILDEVREDGTFIARIIDQRGPGRVLGEGGEVLTEYGAKPPFESRVYVTPEGEAWRLSGLDYLTDMSVPAPTPPQ